MTIKEDEPWRSSSSLYSHGSSLSKYQVEMKRLFLLLLPVGFAMLFLSSCSGCKGRSEDTSSYSSDFFKPSAANSSETEQQATDIDLSVVTAPKGITSDAFRHIRDKWTAANTRSGMLSVGDFKVNADDIEAAFDNAGHLTGVTLLFSPFRITGADDYAEAEKKNIRNIIESENVKISNLISAITAVYGQPARREFDADDTDVHLSTAKQTLALWLTPNARITLTADYAGNGYTMACNTTLVLKTDYTD